MHIGSLAQLDRLSLARAPGWPHLAAKPLAISLFAAGLLWPLTWLVLNGFTLTAIYEESIGYRYFYTLRQLHEGSTYLFLPQGQTANLLFKLVHIGLDLAGLPPTQVRPRIDYFCAGSIALFQLINVAAFAYLLRQARPGHGAFLIALFWLLPFYAPNASAGYILLSPDYMALEAAIAMLSAGLMLKAYRAPDWTPASWLALGVLLGVALATKVTLVIFPGVVLLFLTISTHPLRRTLFMAAAAALTGLCVGLLILFADQSFGYGRLLLQLEHLLVFMRSGGGMGPPDQSWLAWMFSRAGGSPPISALIYLTPLLGLAALALARNRRQLLFLSSLCAGTLAYTHVLYQRDYAVTLLESGFYTFMVLWCVWCVEMDPIAEAGWRRLGQPLRLASGALIAALSVYLAVDFAKRHAMLNLSMIAKTSRAEQEFGRLTRDVTGRRLWLVPDNDGRPMSVESAIMKGGSGQSGIWLDPDSQLMRSIVPDVDFRFERADQRPVNLNDYSAVFFMTRTDLQTRINALNQRYHIDLLRMDCRALPHMQTGTVGMCTAKKGAPPS